MPFGSGARAKGSKGKKDSVSWPTGAAINNNNNAPAGLTAQHGGEEKAPFSSNGITASPFSSNNSGATERMRTLDMDPEAVSHVSCWVWWGGACGGGGGIIALEVRALGVVVANLVACWFPACQHASQPAVLYQGFCFMSKKNKCWF